MHFNSFGLKALYATGYKISPIINTEVKVKKIPYFLHVTDTSKYLKDDQIDLDIKRAELFIKEEENNVCTELLGDANYIAGDFRSEECIDILKKSDIVVTNPPFSLFREYIALLLKYNKSFLVIGNMNSITNREIFSLLKSNDLWLGYNNGSKEYVTSAKYAMENPKRVYKKGDIYYTKMGNTCWYTNVDHLKRHNTIKLNMGFTYYNHETQYAKYDNYDAINVDKLNEIPCDYRGLIGVPISFIDKYCPEQFEIIGSSGELAQPVIIDGKKGSGRFYINNKRLYDRIVIKRKD